MLFDFIVHIIHFLNLIFMKNLLLIVAFLCFIVNINSQVYADFETIIPSPNIVWGASDYGSTANPLQDAVNSSATVGYYTQSDQWCVYQFLAGESINLSGNNYKLYIDIYAPISGRIWLKLEDTVNNTGATIETYGEYTTASAWQTIEFDFSVPENGGDKDAVVNAIDIYFNHGDGVTLNQTWYWDNVTVGVSTDIDDDEVESANYKVFPNPAINEVTIDTDKQIETAVIYSMTGVKVLSVKVLDNKLDISTLSQGTYLLETTDIDGTTICNKLIKK